MSSQPSKWRISVGKAPFAIVLTSTIKAMARTKQKPLFESARGFARGLVFATRTPNLIKDKLLKMDFVQSDTQMCEYLSLKWHLLRERCRMVSGTRGGTRNKPNFTKTHEPGGNSRRSRPD
ncbi:hypothetical protein TNCV_4926011 [Trichonephila clavipes]|nr:hypothetical protein TNCV_4926011 [Trichonephila clavipes]